MKRRNLLKALASAPIFGSPLLAGASKKTTRLGKGGPTKKLVVLFQRGGCDGLNMLVPVEPTQNGYYHNLRPTIGLGSNNLSNVNGSGFFAVHAALNPLVPLINAGNCTMVHAVGYPNPDRSHFEAQSFFETAVPGSGLLDGWLNRYLSTTQGPGQGLIRGISIGWNIPQSVTGTVPVPVSTNFGTAELEVDPQLNGADADAYRQKIRDALALPPTAGNDDVYSTGNKIFDMIDSFQDRNLNNYAPENGAVYPSTGLGNRIMHAAQMLKDDVNPLGIEVVAIDQGGYDTHSNQLNPNSPGNPANGQAYLFTDLAQSMAAFYQDMGSVRMDDILFVVVSEFGRRAYENNSYGTDHGSASVAVIMGNAVGGGLLNGDGNWPGLHQNDLLHGGDLDWVTDYRDIYWEILSSHMGVSNADLAAIIPGHAYTPVGVIP